jgi:hypothetical protein
VQKLGDFSSQKKTSNMATRKPEKTLLCYHLALIDHNFLFLKKKKLFQL